MAHRTVNHGKHTERVVVGGARDRKLRAREHSRVEQLQQLSDADGDGDGQED